jgi:hypothetical protein
MAMRWTFHQPEVAGRGSTTQRLAVLEDGSATWTAEGTAGDGDLDEALGSRAGAGPAPVACRGRLGPRLHRRLVEAARRAMTLGCTARAPRLVDEASTSLAVTWEGEIRSCTVPRAGGGYVAFEQVRAEVIAGLCPPR